MPRVEPPLPGMPEPAAPVTPKARPARRVARFRSKNRTLCGDCCALIHALGVELAPFPRAAKWRVSTGTTIAYLCDLHVEDS